MMTNFFKPLEGLTGTVELQFNIKAKDGLMTVMVMPKATIKDAAASNIKPLCITGTAEELDAEFINAMLAPMEKAAGIISNIATFEKGAQKLADENDAAKKQKDQDKKDRDAKKKKYDALMTKVDAFEKDKNYKAAIGAAKQAKEFTEKPEALEKRIIDLTGKLTQGSIFDAQQNEQEADTTNYLEDFVDDTPETNSTNDEQEADQDDEQEGEND